MYLEDKLMKRILWQKGSVLVLTACMLPILLGITGMAVDMGRAYMEHSRLQNAVDDAVLVGGRAYSDNAKSLSAGHTAVVSALKINYGTEAEKLDISQEVKPSASNENDSYYICQLKTTVPTSFLRLLGKESHDVQAQAAAKIVPAQTVNKLIVAGAGPSEYSDQSWFTDFISHVTDTYWWDFRHTIEYSINTPLNVFHMYNPWLGSDFAVNLTADTLLMRWKGDNWFKGEIDYLDTGVPPFLEPYLNESRGWIKNFNNGENVPVPKQSLSQDYKQLEEYIETIAANVPEEPWNNSLLSSDRWLLHMDGLGSVALGNPIRRSKVMIFEGASGGTTDLDTGQDVFNHAPVGSKENPLIIVARYGDIHLKLTGSYLEFVYEHRREFHGILYAPRGTVTLEGFHSDFYGSIIALNVCIDSRDSTYQYESYNLDSVLSLVPVSEAGK